MITSRGQPLSASLILARGGCLLSTVPGTLSFSTLHLVVVAHGIACLWQNLVAALFVFSVSHNLKVFFCFYKPIVVQMNNITPSPFTPGSGRESDNGSGDVPRVTPGLSPGKHGMPLESGQLTKRPHLLPHTSTAEATASVPEDAPNVDTKNPASDINVAVAETASHDFVDEDKGTEGVVPETPPGPGASQSSISPVEDLIGDDLLSSLNPSDPFDQMWNTMCYNGWSRKSVWKKGSQGEKYRMWCRSGFKGEREDGIEGKDYFLSEDDLQTFVMQRITTSSTHSASDQSIYVDDFDQSCYTLCQLETLLHNEKEKVPSGFRELLDQRETLPQELIRMWKDDSKGIEETLLKQKHDCYEAWSKANKVFTLADTKCNALRAKKASCQSQKKLKNFEKMIRKQESLCKLAEKEMKENHISKNYYNHDLTIEAVYSLPKNLKTTMKFLKLHDKEWHAGIITVANPLLAAAGKEEPKFRLVGFQMDNPLKVLSHHVWNDTRFHSEKMKNVRKYDFDDEVKDMEWHFITKQPDNDRFTVSFCRKDAEGKQFFVDYDVHESFVSPWKVRTSGYSNFVQAAVDSPGKRIKFSAGKKAALEKDNQALVFELPIVKDIRLLYVPRRASSRTCMLDAACNALHYVSVLNKDKAFEKVVQDLYEDSLQYFGFPDAEANLYRRLQFHLQPLNYKLERHKQKKHGNHFNPVDFPHKQWIVIVKFRSKTFIHSVAFFNDLMFAPELFAPEYGHAIPVSEQTVTVACDLPRPKTGKWFEEVWYLFLNTE